MNHFGTLMHGCAIAALLGLGACNMAPVKPSSTTMSAHLSGSSEAPAVTTRGSGTVAADLNGKNNVLTWSITYVGLSGPATAGHFHGPAIAGETAHVVVPITGSLVSPINGVTNLTAAEVNELLAGHWYVNLHTSANPGGEIRGQITVDRRTSDRQAKDSDVASGAAPDSRAAGSAGPGVL
jgi:hypothetical protein